MSEAELEVKISMDDRFTPELRAMARPFQEQMVRSILDSLPTILHNRLSDRTREPLAAAFVASMEELGYHILPDPPRSQEPRP